jgi:hypothetical protein
LKIEISEIATWGVEEAESPGGVNAIMATRIPAKQRAINDNKQLYWATKSPQLVE